MSASDQSPTTPSSRPADVPTPVSGSGAGAGSAELATESTDPQELRTLLERARERLSFYESFDRIIGENLRRTGEMMAETVALREQAAQATRERQTMDVAFQADRERYRALIEGALDEVRTAQPVIESMVTRLQGALDELSTDVDAIPAATLSAEAEPAPNASEPEFAEETAGPPVETAQEAESTADEPTTLPEPDVTEEVDAADAGVVVEETRTEEDAPADTTPDDGLPGMDVLAHGVPSANIAIGLLNLLRGLEQVSTVEAREFADGELRLHLSLTNAIPETALTDWLSGNNGSLTSRNGKAIELTFS